MFQNERIRQVKEVYTNQEKEKYTYAKKVDPKAKGNVESQDIA